MSEALMYAHDIVLLLDKQEAMQKLIDTWTSEIEKMPVEVNVNKSKTMIINGQLNQNRMKKI